MNYNRLIFAFTLLLLSQVIAYAQQPQSVQQMMNDAKKQIAEDKDMDPEDRANLLKMFNNKAMTNKAKWMDAHPKEMQEAIKQDEKMTALPSPDIKRLASLPAQPLTDSKMDQLLVNMASKLQSQLDNTDKTNAGQLIKANQNSEKLTSLAVVTWYSGNPEEGLLLAINAAHMHKDSLTLNNLGAMLNEAGHEEKAIPVLQYALLKSPNNASLLNNIGRAYLGLGDGKKARKMFLMCVAQAPTHPEANNSLGCLDEAEGKKDEAAAHFEKSIEGAYNENAYEHLSQLQPDVDIIKLMQHHYKVPAYFNQFSITLPPECINIRDKEQVQYQHEAFQKNMDKLMSEYAAMENQADEASSQQIDQMKHTIMKGLAEGHMIKASVSPFIKIASLMIQKILKNYISNTALAKRDYDSSLSILMSDYRQKSEKMAADFDAQKRMGPMGECGICCLNCDEVNKRACIAQEQLATSYQHMAADLHTNFKQRYRRILLNDFDDMLYWNCLLGVNTYDMQGNFYGTVEGFLKQMKYLSESTPFIPAEGCDVKKFVPGNSEEDLAADKKPDCPLSVDFAFIVGKISLDCTSFSISGGEGVTAGYKKDFTNGQTTLSIGVGISAGLGTNTMGMKASAGETIYVTFDGNGQPTDVGMKTSIGAGVNAGPVSTGVDAGCTVSMNSGWNFTHSGFNNNISL